MKSTNPKLNNKSNTSSKSTKNTNKQLDTTGYGRKNKYFSHVQPRLDQISIWCRNGLTEDTICKNLDVGVSNWSRYKLEHQELRETLKTKDQVDELVENALLKRALGYKYEEEKIEEDLATGKKTITKTKKEMPPDTTAQIFWLKNRQPDKWQNSDRIEIQTTKEQMGIHRELIKALKERSIRKTEEVRDE